MEHLWNEMDQRLRLCKDLPTSKNNLWKKMQEAWNNIIVEVVQKLVKSMRNRVQALLKTRGGYAKY